MICGAREAPLVRRDKRREKEMADTDVPAPADSYSRKSTGLVRSVTSLQQVIFNASASNPLGAAMVFGLFALVLFPRANPYIALVAALFLGTFVWMTFALLTSTIPRVGGDYTLNSRILTPWLGFGGSLAIVVSSLIAVGITAWWTGTQGLSPAFSVIGAVNHSHLFTELGSELSGSNKGLSFAVAIAVLALVSALAILGTRLIMRIVVILFLIAAAGFLVDILVLLFTSNDSFKTTVDNAAGQGAYAHSVAVAEEAGVATSKEGYSATSTFGAIYTMLGVTLWVWWGTYTSAEFRGAGQRRREIGTIFGAGLGQGLALLFGILIFLNTVGADFFSGALSGGFEVGGGSVSTAGYAYFGALVAGGKVLVALLSLAFIGWWVPLLYANQVQAGRSMFAWALDGLLPSWVATVNERRHTPLAAILAVFVLSSAAAAWVSFSSNFFAIFNTMQLFAYIPIILAGISALVLPRRRPELFRDSPADWKIAGVPVLAVAGAGCLAVGVLAFYLVLRFHENLGITGGYFTAMIIACLAVFPIAIVWYLVARALQRSSGVDLDLAYSAIPPD
jgi:amino acid transporter